MLGDIDSQIQRNISDPSAAAKYRKISDQDAAGIDEQIKAYESTFLVDAEKRGLAAYHPRWDAYRKAYTEVLEAAARGDIEAAKTAYFADAAPLYGEVDSDLAGLARVNRTEAKALDSRIGDKYRSSRVITLVASWWPSRLGAASRSSSPVASSPASASCSRGSARSPRTRPGRSPS